MNETSSDSEYRMRELNAGLERRIEALERIEGRHVLGRWVGPVLGGVALFVALIVANRTSDAHRVGTVATSLQANAFVLKDHEGVERASLGLRDDGGASLALTDMNGRPRLRLAVLPDGSPGVSLLDADGESRAILGLLDDGTTTLVFADRGSVARGVFALTPDGAVRMIFSDPNGVTRTAVGVDGAGQPEVNTIDVDEGRSGGGGGG
jgi:hypothetical protein